MTDVDTVRLIIADPLQHDRAETTTPDANTTEFMLPNAPVATGSAKVFLDGTSTTAFTINEVTGVVTLTSAPAAGVTVVITYDWSILSDADITSLLSLEGSNVKLAAAQGLDIIASSEALVQKRITLLDIKTDGPAEARALREHAKALRQQVEDGFDPTGEGLVDYAEMGLSPFGDRQRWWNEYLRTNG
jgi:hypothetical protein